MMRPHDRAAPAGEPAPEPFTPPRRNGLAVASLVCGIITLLLAPSAVLSLLAAPFGVAAVVLGTVGRRRARQPGVPGRRMAIAGTVTGVVGLIVATMVLITLANLLQDPELLERLEEEGARAASLAGALHQQP